MAARADGDGVQLQIRNFAAYCRPVPTFDASFEGDRIRAVERQAWYGEVDHAICRHSLTVRLNQVPAGAHIVHLQGVSAMPGNHARTVARSRRVVVGT